MTTPTRSELWITDPAAYRAGLHEKLDGRAPIDVLASTGRVLRGITKSYSVEQLRTRPFAGKWTPLEVIGHLCDVEWVDGFRMRLILAQDRPVLTGMEQDLWVAAQRYNDRDPGELIDQFEWLRAANVALVRGLTDSEKLRVGLHDERGEESLGLMIEMLAGHDVHHVEQIQRYLRAISS